MCDRARLRPRKHSCLLLIAASIEHLVLESQKRAITITLGDSGFVIQVTLWQRLRIAVSNGRNRVRFAASTRCSKIYTSSRIDRHRLFLTPLPPPSNSFASLDCKVARVPGILCSLWLVQSPATSLGSSLHPNLLIQLCCRGHRLRRPHRSSNSCF